MSQIIKDMTEITRCGVDYRTEKLAPLGLKACHASYLLEICDEPGISQDNLAQRICINKSNVARQVAILEENGFVSRQPCTADKRVMKLYPTEKTLEMLPQIQQIMNCQWIQAIKRLIDNEQLGVRHKSTDDHDFLLHPLGKVGRKPVQLIVQAKDFQQLMGFLPSQISIQAICQHR